MYAQVGDKIRITYMKGEPNYTGKEGIVYKIDDFGQIWITDCGLAVIPDMDEFEIIS